MRKSLIILTTVGIIFSAIVFWWQWTSLPPPPPEAEWSEEAQAYRDDWMARIYITVQPGSMVPDTVAEAEGEAARLANATDGIIHLVDLRIGMAYTWWIISQPGGVFDRQWPMWEDAWERLREIEGIVGYVPPVDWSVEAFKYYYPLDPLDPAHGLDDYYFDPDLKNCTAKVLYLASGGNVAEFRAMWANVTVKAEELAADDGVVDLIDLRTAMVTILHEQYPDTYPTTDLAKLEELEQTVGCAPPS